ncbi:protein of unknown function (plasmid) [Methylocella tundrae]|uniref:Uncharacterized protein n=1 Tax=Methylocella tundrae TaxID=227605 RepID=A0A4U8Z8A1_METTU|nr:protein of unknown function [Methylocella tundrae]
MTLFSTSGRRTQNTIFQLSHIVYVLSHITQWCSRHIAARTVGGNIGGPNYGVCISAADKPWP